jgi:cytochrome c5
MIKFKNGNIILFSVLLVIFSGSCESNRNHPGYDYFPDMFYSEAYETYSENPVYDDGSTMRKPVEGSISREFIPFQYSLEEGERERAGEELSNPFAGDQFVLDRGKEIYTNFCIMCHGESGKGEGYLHTSGLYVVVPRTLVGEVARDLKDGEIYHSISVGFGSMGPHKSLTRPDDRWKAISYIRQVLQENELKETNASE